MAKKTMVSRLLEAADSLLQQKPRSAAFRRRAVSTTYYAVFHALAKVCAASLFPSMKADSDEYGRIYRALEHAALGSAFQREPLSRKAELKAIGEITKRLREERERADYLPPSASLFTVEEVQELLGLAREAINLIEGLSPEDRHLIAVFLILKTKERRP